MITKRDCSRGRQEREKKIQSAPVGIPTGNGSGSVLAPSDGLSVAVRQTRGVSLPGKRKKEISTSRPGSSPPSPSSKWQASKG